MDAIAADIMKWDKLKEKCTIGYVMWSIWPTPNNIWGKPNGRIMTQERMTGMYKSFLGSGIQNIKNDTVILVAAKKSWIKNYSDVKSIDGLATGDIPMLEWTDEGKEAFQHQQFCPVEGMGRRAGVQMLYEHRTKEIEVMQRELENPKVKKGETAETVEQKKKAKEESIEFKMSERHRKTLWALRIVDSGEDIFNGRDSWK